jgi:superfamily II DNA or RNA helicase
MVRYLSEVEKKRLIIITPNAALVEQLYLDFKNEYGWESAEEKCTLIYGDSKDKLTAKQKQKLEELALGEEVMLKDVVISTWQSLQNKLPTVCVSCEKLKKKKPEQCDTCDKLLKKSTNFFGTFSAVIVDEAHSTRGIVLRDVLSRCVNAVDFKIGLSGTLPDDGLDAAWIEGAIGRKEDVIHLHELISLGLLPPLEINAIRIPYAEDKRKYICRQNYRDEYSLVTNNGSRKKVLEMLINSKQINTDQNTVILYRNKDSLKEMHDFLKEKFPDFKYHIIQGDVSTKERQIIREELSNSVGNIIVATYGTMKQGINIPQLHNLVFAEFSKSMYEIVQAMGRVARAHPNKKISRIFDIFDDCSYHTSPRTAGKASELKMNYSLEHFYVRNYYYENEKIPVTEYSLEGMYEATIYPDALEDKKELAKKKAGEKAKKKKKKADENIGPLGDKSQFA